MHLVAQVVHLAVQQLQDEVDARFFRVAGHPGENCRRGLDPLFVGDTRTPVAAKANKICDFEPDGEIEAFENIPLDFIVQRWVIKAVLQTAVAGVGGNRQPAIRGHGELIHTDQLDGLVPDAGGMLQERLVVHSLIAEAPPRKRLLD